MLLTFVSCVRVMDLEQMCNEWFKTLFVMSVMNTCQQRNHHKSYGNTKIKHDSIMSTDYKKKPTLISPLEPHVDDNKIIFENIRSVHDNRTTYTIRPTDVNENITYDSIRTAHNIRNKRSENVNPCIPYLPVRPSVSKGST